MTRRDLAVLAVVLLLLMLALGHGMRGWNATPQPFPSDIQLPTLKEGL